MAATNKNSLLYTSITRLLAYMKGNTTDIIDKQLFIDIRELFKEEYRAASRFYNSGNIDELIKYSKNILNREYEKVLHDNSDVPEMRDIIQNQYYALMKTLKDSYDNINILTILKIIKEIDNKDEQKNDIRLIIKGLIILQVVYNIADIIETTTENNGTYNYITEYKNDASLRILEHIDEYSYLLEEDYDDFSVADISILSEAKLDDEIDKDDINKDDLDVEKFYEDDLLKDGAEVYNDDNLDPEDDDISDIDMIIQNNIEVSYDSGRINDYIFRLYLKNILLLKNAFENICDYNNYSYLPSINYIMYWIIVLLMHTVNKF